MALTISLFQSLPPWRDLLHPTPETYTQILTVWQYFAPLTIVQWLTSYFPMGKTSLESSPLNIPGRIAWSSMELVAPINLLYHLTTLPPKMNISPIPTPNKLLATLYITHYINRAIISPLFASPSMSPIHALIVVCAFLFNWFNSTCLAAWLVGYHVSVPGYRTDESNGTGSNPLPYVGIVLFVLGMAGNIASERTLFSLRRAEAEKGADKKKDGGKANMYDKVYVIPPAKGLFRSVLYPHYVWEWVEWAGFILVGTAVYPAVGGRVSGREVKLVPWLVPFAALAVRLRVQLPLPAIIFLVNTVVAMVPQARRGKKWYLDRFGREKVAGRGAVVPFSSWL
ncbi:hypothetical protein BBP40_012312 [Aspergillus hancockii]|nr:hypothetical protein BBP40_012312 [Aspergillus hancockii]